MSKACIGKSTHVCTTCGKQYFCYNCPDRINQEYSENMCESCLEEMFQAITDSIVEEEK